jgi:major membrane immunogen (membrane-anchored lipoprotein)
MKTRLTYSIGMVSLLLTMGMAANAQNDLDQRIDNNINDWVGTYKHLHEHPELSTEEKETSALVAGQLKKIGYEVTDHFGKYDSGNAAYGVVAVLRNGTGPTVYVRTDMDALPVTENTGLPYASKVREWDTGAYWAAGGRDGRRRGGDAACGLVHKISEAGLCDCAARFLLPAGRDGCVACRAHAGGG